MARARRRYQNGSVARTRGATSQERVEIAQVAARMMAEEGVHDFAEAKARAADQLGVHGRQTLPRNDEIEAELRVYQALFQADEQPVWLAHMRRLALDAMDQLAEFAPRLTGAVWRGTAPRDAEITLHLFVDPPERVATFLLDRGIPWQLDAWIGRFGGAREIELPLYRIAADDQPIRLIVFPEAAPREAPRSPIDGKPMARATRAQLADLIQSEGGGGAANERA